MEKHLPFGDSPLKTYPDLGGAFGIIDAYTKDYLPWIYNYLLQLYVGNNHQNGLIIYFSKPNLMVSLPWLEVNKLDRQFIIDIFGNYTDFLKSAIDHNKYIYLNLDIYFNHYWNQGNSEKRHAVHEHMIYGYDDKLQVFYFSDNYLQGKYGHGVLPYTEIELGNRSFKENNIRDGFHGIYLLAYKKEYSYYYLPEDLSSYHHIYSKELAGELIEDFLNSKCSEWRWQTPCLLHLDGEYNKNCWGLDIYRYLYEHLNLAKSYQGNIDIRGLHTLQEHKWLIKNTYEYITDIYGLKKEDYILEKCIESYNISKIAVNLSIKYNITHYPGTLNRIKKYYEIVSANDIFIMKKIKELIGYQVLQTQNTT